MQKHGRALGWTEQQKLLTAIQPDSPPIRTTILLQLRAGLRVSEALGLQWRNVMPLPADPVSLYISTAITKSKQPREVPIPPDLREHLLATYFSMREIAPSRGLEETHVVGTAYKRRFTARWANYKLRTICKRATIAPIHTHTLRATFATNVLRVSNTRVVQLLLGHENLSSTQHYLTPGFDVLTDAVTNAASWTPPPAPAADQPPTSEAPQ